MNINVITTERPNLVATIPLPKKSPPKPADTEYLPEYRLEDKALAFLVSCGISDSNGQVVPLLAQIAKIPLNESEKGRLHACISQSLNILASVTELQLKTTAEQLIKEFIFQNKLYEECELVGSASYTVLHVGYFKRFISCLLHQVNPEMEENRIQDLVDRLFSKEFEAALKNRLERKLADVDYRLIHTHTPAGCEELMLHQSQQKLVNFLVAKVAPLSAEPESRRRQDLLERLKTAVPSLDWNWLTLDSKDFYSHIIKNLGFNKLYTSCKEGEFFSIANLGELSELTADIVFTLKLHRDEMFPSIKIPFSSMLNPQTAECPVYPTGSNWVQSLIDKMCGCVRPDLEKATEDDLKMLFCRKTKGETNAVPHSEKQLVEIADRASRNFHNKTVRKVLRSRPEFKNKLDKIFPYFLAQLLKDATEVHFGKDPLAAISLTINALESLIANRPFEECEVVLHEMSAYWEPLRKSRPENHILYTIADLLTSPYSLESERQLVRQLPLLKLCAFMHCQASTPSQKSAVSVYPRRNESIPCFEVQFDSPRGRYSLILSAPSPKMLLTQTLKYFGMARLKDSPLLIETISKAFLPQRPFGGPLSSPMAQDLQFFDHDLTIFENASLSQLIRQHTLFSLFLSFSTQAQLKTWMPVTSYLINLPTIVSKVQGFTALLFDHLDRWVEHSPAQKNALGQFRKMCEGPKELSESALTEKWLNLLARSEECRPLALQFFRENIHLSTEVDPEYKRKSIFDFYHEVKKGDPVFTLRLLHFMLEKAYINPIKSLQLLFEIDLKRISETPGSLAFLDKIILIQFNHLRKDNSHPLQELLEKFKGFSQLSNECLQKLHKPNSEEDPGFSTQEIDIRLIKIEEMIERDLEEASTIMLSNAHQLTEAQLEGLVLKLITKGLACHESGKVEKFLGASAIRKKRLMHEEKHFTMVLEFLERIPSSQKISTQINLLPVLLEYFTNHQSPRISTPTLCRLIHEIVSAYQTPSLLIQPKQQDLQNAVKNALKMLFNALRANDCHSLVVHFAQVALLQIELRNSLIIVQPLITESLQCALNEQELTPGLLAKIRDVIPWLMQELSDKMHSCLVQLVHKAPLDQKLFYLRFLAEGYSLVDAAHLNLLIPVFEDFIGKGQYENAIETLRYFTGKIQWGDDLSSKVFFDFIKRLTRQQRWMLACQALAYSPFSWNDISVMRGHAEQVLQKLVSTSQTLALNDLKCIFTVINEFPIRDINLVAAFYPLCVGTMDTSLAKKMWEVFKKSCVDLSSAPQIEDVIISLMSCIKVHTAADMASILSDPAFIRVCASLPPQEMRDRVFRKTIKTLMHIVKTNKIGADRQNSVVHLEKEFKDVAAQLKPSEAVIDEIKLELVGCYLNLNDKSLLNPILGHLKRAGAHKRTELYFRQVHATLERLSKYKIEDSDIDHLLFLFTEALQDTFKIKLISYLPLCESPRLHETGLKILESCVASPHFALEELWVLKSNPSIVPFLKIISHSENPEWLNSCAALVENPRLQVHIPTEDKGIVEASLADSLLKQNSSTLKERGIRLIFSRLNDISKRKDVTPFVLLVENGIKLFFEEKNDVLLDELVQTYIPPSILFEIIDEIKLDRIKDFFVKADTNRVVRFVALLNGCLINNLSKKIDLTKDEFSIVKHWVALITGTDNEALIQEGKTLVGKLETLWSNSPVHLLEIKLRLSARLKDKTDLPYIREGLSRYHEVLETFRRGSQETTLYVDPKLYAETYIYFSTIALENEFTDKRTQLSNMIKNCFRIVHYCAEKDQGQLIIQGNHLWIRACESDHIHIYDSLADYDPRVSGVLLKSFKFRIFSLLEKIRQEKSPIPHEVFLCGVFEAFDYMVMAIQDSAHDLDDMLLLHDLYDQFVIKASTLRQNTSTKVRALDALVKFAIGEFGLPKALKQSAEYYTSLMNHIENEANSINPKEHKDKTTLNKLKKKVIPKLKLEYYKVVNRQ